MSDAIVLGLRQSLESLQADEASHMDHALEESRLLTMGVAASVAAEATTHSLYIESAMTETERIEWAISASMSDAEVMSTPSGPGSATASASARGEGRSGVEFFTNATQQKGYTIVILCSLPCLTSLR